MINNTDYIKATIPIIKKCDIESVVWVNNRKLPELIDEMTENINNLNKKLRKKDRNRWKYRRR